MDGQRAEQETLFSRIAQMHVHEKMHQSELLSDRFWLKINYVSIEKKHLYTQLMETYRHILLPII